MVPCVFPEEIGPRLNDLFGIQARGGCACAGPYGQNLLGLDASTAHAFDKANLRDETRKNTLDDSWNLIAS